MGLNMILNTYPINDDQPIPQFVKNFHKDLRQFAINSNKAYEDTDEIVADYLKQKGLSASISLHTITVDDWGTDNISHYLIICWQDEYKQWEFIEHYKDHKSKRIPKQFVSKHH
jgi:hypothetical protein